MDQHAKIITMAKGAAAAMDIICKFFNPPVMRRTNANAAWRTPHTAILLFGGLRSPLVEYMERTKVAELADVIKNVEIKTTIIMDIIPPNG